MIAPSLRTRTTWLFAILALLTTSQVLPAAAQSAPTLPAEPDFETHGALPWEEPPGAMPFVVWEVADGDTIRVVELEDADEPDPWWEPVRIIGVDTPEKSGPYTREECYGEEASAFVYGLLPRGTTVYLQADNDLDIPDNDEFTDDGMEFDDNGRWLMHVYLRDSDTEDYYLLSEIITLGGYVEVPGYEGNTYFVNELNDAEELARDEDRGLWGACDA